MRVLFLPLFLLALVCGIAEGEPIRQVARSSSSCNSDSCNPQTLNPYGPEVSNSTYMNACHAAAVEKKTLIVFVGGSDLLTGKDGVIPLSARLGERTKGIISCSVKSLEGYPAKCIIVCEPNEKGDWVSWKATLPADAPDADIARAVRGDDGSDALDEVNAMRTKRGLRPYLRDEGLTQGARACAAYRAANRIKGHTPQSDFSFLPSGVTASAAGCAGLTPDWGFQACAVYDNYTYCGAAWVMGSDGLRYSQLFVR